MKRLLLLIFLCLVPSAQAMDYVKCEAMQKAQSRIQVSISQLKRRRQEKLTYATRTAREKCSHLHEYSPGPVRVSPEWKACAGEVMNSPEMALPGGPPEIEQLEKRAARVQADYDAAGCY